MNGNRIVEQEDVRMYFQKHACNILDVRLMIDPRSHRSRGFAFVDLADEDSVRIALTLSGCKEPHPIVLDSLAAVTGLVVEVASSPPLGDPEIGNDPENMQDLNFRAGLVQATDRLVDNIIGIILRRAVGGKMLLATLGDELVHDKDWQAEKRAGRKLQQYLETMSSHFLVYETTNRALAVSLKHRSIPAAHLSLLLADALPPPVSPFLFLLVALLEDRNTLYENMSGIDDIMELQYVDNWLRETIAQHVRQAPNGIMLLSMNKEALEHALKFFEMMASTFVVEEVQDGMMAVSLNTVPSPSPHSPCSDSIPCPRSSSSSSSSRSSLSAAPAPPATRIALSLGGVVDTARTWRTTSTEETATGSTETVQSSNESDHSEELEREQVESIDEGSDDNHEDADSGWGSRPKRAFVCRVTRWARGAGTQNR